MSEPAPWQCPACKTWLAPHVTEHRCEPPGAVVSVTSIDPPGSGGTFASATFPPGTVTVNVAGNVTSEHDLLGRLQGLMLQRASRSRQGMYTLPGRAA